MKIADIKIGGKRLRQAKPETIAMLAESMGARGLLQPVVVAEGGVLIAGLNRVEAARRLGWEEIAHTEVGNLSPDDRMLAEIDENLIRAELSPAEVAVHLGERKRIYLKKHPETKRGHGGGVAKAAKGRGANSQNAKEQASAFDVDTATKTGRHRSTVARSVARDEKIPEIAAVVGTSLDQGDELDALAALPVEQQAALIEQAAAGKKVSAKPAAKQRKRESGEKDSGQKQANANAARTLNDREYGVVYLDPPWRHETWSEAGKDRAADNHYETLDIAGVRERRPPCADNCVVFVWTTVPMLAEAIGLLSDWGLTYRSCLVWRKPVPITGYWSRNNGEILLIGAANVVAPAMGTQPTTVIDAEAGEHSRKPALFADLIRDWFPRPPKIEMYARPPFRPGWTVWGNEVPSGIMEVPEK